MTIELKQYALNTAVGMVDADQVLPLAQQFYAWLANDASNEAAPAEDKPKRTRAKAEPAAAAAAETPAANKLEPTDEGNVSANSAESQDATTSTATSPSEPAGPTRDDALTAATKFSQLSAAQGGGSDALADVLKQFKVERFSALTEDQYGAFIGEMKKRQDKASAASSALS